MRFRWFFPIAVLLPLRLFAADNAVKPRVATITINPSEVTTLHLRPEFESTIHMPEEITSVILGSPGNFKAEHNEGEPEYVYVKPITKEAADSNLLIATKSGLHVTLELISDGVGASGSALPVDFLIEYRTSRSFLIAGSAGAEHAKSEPTGTCAIPLQSRIPWQRNRSLLSTKSMSCRYASMRRRGRNGRASRLKLRLATYGNGAIRRSFRSRSSMPPISQWRLCRRRFRSAGAR
jgi:hypothetical protein